MAKAARKRICIVGFSVSSRDLAPKDDSWEYWGLNHLYPYVERPWSRWFEMHPLSWIKARAHKWPDYPEWLSLAPIPVYMLDSYREVPESVPYPRDDVVRTLGLPLIEAEDYFASGAAYMLALAIHESPPEIAVYGLDMVKEDEYAVQRPNFEFLLGIAHGRGIKITVAKECALLKSAWMYGYEESPIERVEWEREQQILRVQDLDEEVKRLKKKIDQTQGEYFGHVGAFQEARIRLDHLNDIRHGALYGKRPSDILTARGSSNGRSEGAAGDAARTGAAEEAEGREAGRLPESGGVREPAQEVPS